MEVPIGHMLFWYNEEPGGDSGCSSCIPSEFNPGVQSPGRFADESQTPNLRAIRIADRHLYDVVWSVIDPSQNPKQARLIVNKKLLQVQLQTLSLQQTSCSCSPDSSCLPCGHSQTNTNPATLQLCLSGAIDEPKQCVVLQAVL